jgi:hypothetical protein
MANIRKTMPKPKKEIDVKDNPKCPFCGKGTDYDADYVWVCNNNRKHPGNRPVLVSIDVYSE